MQLRNSKEVSKEDYNTFYKSTFKEFIDPQAYTHFSTEVCQLTRVCLQCCTKVLGPSLDKTYFRENIEKFVSHLCIIVIDLKFLIFQYEAHEVLLIMVAGRDWVQESTIYSRDGSL